MLISRDLIPPLLSHKDRSSDPAFDSPEVTVILHACLDRAASSLSSNERMRGLDALRRMVFNKESALIDDQLMRCLEKCNRSIKKVTETNLRDIAVIESKMRRQPESMTSEHFQTRLAHVNSDLVHSLETIEAEMSEVTDESRKSRAALILALSLSRIIANSLELPFIRLMPSKPTRKLHAFNHPLSFALSPDLETLRSKFRPKSSDSLSQSKRVAGTRLLFRTLRGCQLRQMHSLLTTLAILN